MALKVTYVSIVGAWSWDEWSRGDFSGKFKRRFRAVEGLDYKEGSQDLKPRILE